MTPTQIESLLFINYIRPNAATVNTLAKYLSCKPVTVSGIIDTLENKKLVRRNRKGRDKRQVLLSLTPKGMKAVGVIKDLGKEIEEIISKFNHKDKEVLEYLLINLWKNLSQKGYVANAEICKTCRYFNSNRYPRASKPHYCEYLNIVLGEKDIYKECPDYKDVLN